MKSILYAALFAAATLTCACASDPVSLQLTSASQIGQNYQSSDIVVSDVNRGATRVTWTATTPRGATYKCEASDMLHNASCAQQKHK